MFTHRNIVANDWIEHFVTVDARSYGTYVSGLVFSRRGKE